MDLHKVPPEKHETVRVPWTTDERQLLDVITIGVDEVLLNPHSRRIRSQLQDDPAWEDLRKDPFSEAAQRTIERHVRDAREPDEFQALKDSLIEDGQTDPGVMTHTGLLINANTRAVPARPSNYDGVSGSRGRADPFRFQTRVSGGPLHRLRRQSDAGLPGDGGRPRSQADHPRARG